MATLNGALYEIEAKQTDPLHPRFEINNAGALIAVVRKENGKWLAEDEDCLKPDEVKSIGSAIDEKTKNQY